jgi:hypothetical protein
MSKPARDPWERILEQVTYKVYQSELGECWVWMGRWTSSSGYGLMGIGGWKRKYVHRVAYEHHYGTILEGCQIAHKCDIPRCVNPDHLRMVTSAENQADMVAKGRSKRGDSHWNWKGGISKNYRTGGNRRPGKKIE